MSRFDMKINKEFVADEQIYINKDILCIDFHYFDVPIIE